MSYRLSKRSLSRLEGVHPDLIKLVKAAITDSPFDFGIPRSGGLRTTEDQQKLYAIGRSPESVREGDRPVTYVDGIRKKSRHQAKEDGYGHAFDIYIYIHETKSASWSKTKLTAVAEHIKKVAEELGIDITWGGDWKKFKDMPHFELA